MSNNQQDSYEYDVFVSYCPADRTWVRDELLTALEKAGLKVCDDRRNFKAGASRVNEIERAVLTSRKTLLVLTPDYVESEWAEFGNSMVQSLDPASRDQRFIPLLKQTCNLPLRIRQLIPVDLTDPNKREIEIAWRQLLTALGNQPQETQPSQNLPKQWLLAHPYGMSPNFTGRVAERQMLSDWLAGDSQHPLFVLKALGGFGKSALTWHWLTHNVSERDWPAVVWWSFYEEKSGFDNFVYATLAYLNGREPTDVKPRERVAQLLGYLQQQGVLLILDGYERELRAYSSMGAAYQGDGETQITDAGRDCLNPLADAFFRGLCSLPNLRSKVLMSTRLRPRLVEVTGGMLLAGCREESLTQMQPIDAVAFCRTQGIRGNRGEIEQACEAYGFHPLSLRLLAGLVINDFEKPGDIQAAQSLDLTGSMVQQQHHVLEQSYTNLSAAQQSLLSRLACFRSPVEYSVLAAIKQAEIETSEHTDDDTESTPLPTKLTDMESSRLKADLQDLIARGLVQRDGSRFDLHPIVRRYAYDRMTAQTRSRTHGQLRDYFAAVPAVEKVQTLDDLAPTIELYHHMVRAEQYDEAQELLRDRLIPAPLYFQLGAYQLCTEILRALFPQGEGQPPQLQSEIAQGWTLGALANSYTLVGQPTKALPLFEQDIAIMERTDDQKNWAITLGNLAEAQSMIGALQAAEANLHREMSLSQEIEQEFQGTIWHQQLGQLLAYLGNWARASEVLDTALKLFEHNNNSQGQSVVWACRALQALLTMRSSEAVEEAKGEHIKIALAAAVRSLELADENARIEFPYERDYVRAHWLLGAAQRLQPNLTDSDHHLTEALRRCRAINNVESEANILLDLARLRCEQGNPTEALHLANEARTIAERCGYVLQGADIHLFLAEQALGEGDRAKAKEHASEALLLATCDGGDYTYKVAYDEAQALLEQL